MAAETPQVTDPNATPAIDPNVAPATDTNVTTDWLSSLEKGPTEDLPAEDEAAITNAISAAPILTEAPLTTDEPVAPIVTEAPPTTDEPVAPIVTEAPPTTSEPVVPSFAEQFKAKAGPDALERLKQRLAATETTPTAPTDGVSA